MLALVVAAQVAIVAHTAPRVAVCEPIEVSVAVSASGRALPQLLPPAFAPFDVMQRATAPGVHPGNGAGAGTIYEYKYVLVAAQPGRYVIPAFQARADGERVQSAPLAVQVEPRRGPDQPTVLVRAQVETDGVPASRAPGPDTVYVGQQATYVVAVFLDPAMRDRLRRNPTFYPPDMQGMLAYDLPAAGQSGHVAGASPCFDALVYRRALFPLRSGVLTIPPAQLTYSVPVSASFFSREESHDLQTDSVVVVAVEPPAAGRPAGFDGAVGRFQLSQRVSSPTGRVGDPFVLTVRISGTGNVKLLPAPHLAVPWATAVRSDDRVQVDSSGARVGGRKEFDWILTPRTAGSQDVPALEYAYFDPATSRYRTARASPVRVQIQAGALAVVDTATLVPPLPIRTSLGGDAGGPLSSHPLFWLVLALVPIPAVRARWRGRGRRRAVSAPSAMTRLTAAVDAPAAATPREVRRLYVEALADRLGVDAEALATAGGVRHAARRAGAAPETADQAEAMLRALDAAAFGGVDAGARASARDAMRVLARLDAEALPRRELPFRGTLLALALLVAAGATLHAVQATTPADAFAAGVEAYQKQDFAGARAAFARAVALAPRSTDAWVNLGTAAWAAGDTVGAVLGWRRALALQPTAADARDGLGMVQATGGSSPGYPWPVPPDAPLLLMAICWCAAWVLWHPRFDSRAAWARHWPVPLVVAAAALGIAAIAVQENLAGRDVAVVARRAALRTDPALGADVGPSVLTGEMVRVLNQSGAWDRVELSGGRQGWLPAQGLVRLDAAVPPASVN